MPMRFIRCRRAAERYGVPAQGAGQLPERHRDAGFCHGELHGLPLLGGLNRNQDVCWSDGACEAELGDLACEAADLGCGRGASKMVWAKILIEGAVAEHVIGGGQDGGCYGADGLLGSAAVAQALELSLKVAALFAGAGPSALHQRSLVMQPVRAARSLSGGALTPRCTRRSNASGSRSPAIRAPMMARPDLPITWVSTEPSFRLASSSVFWMRWAWLACSRTSCLRVRSRARMSWVGASGTKLARTRPWARRSASQAASATSVLRPGTLFTCAALARIRVTSPSERMCQTGFQ